MNFPFSVYTVSTQVFVVKGCVTWVKKFEIMSPTKLLDGKSSIKSPFKVSWSPEPSNTQGKSSYKLE